MTERTNKRLALGAELCAVLARYEDILCAPFVEEDDGLVVLQVRFHPSTPDQALRSLELLGDLRYLSGLAQVRAFASEYGIDSAQLEALLPNDDGSRHMTFVPPAVLPQHCGNCGVVYAAGTERQPAMNVPNAYTPGPWRISNNFNEPNMIEIWSPESGPLRSAAMVASVVDLAPRNGDANARLIVKAPEMRAMLDGFCNGDNCRNVEAIEAARVLLAEIDGAVQ